MSKRIVSLSLDEETINQLDELAAKMGVSRSRVAEMTLKTACGNVSVANFTKWLFSGGDESKGADNQEIVNHVVRA